ncbi:MAG: Flp pilus assembly protein CpaB [unclassified Hahellaceae]|nr:Flp pilus assembly protein CpaB [Hahellaceae bacterium]|tara:strand:- start:89007 stop:89843 length:837 start_codon:yes stop_codon:yes gene_type:complete
MEVNFMKGVLKSWVMIIVALIVGGLAVYLSASYLDAKEESLTARLKAQFATTVEILVASQDIEAGAFASAGNLAVASADPEFLPADILTPAEFESVKALEIMQAIPAGKPLLRSYLGSEIAYTFSELIPVGFRPVTIRVDENSSNERMIEVGDRVDLLKAPSESEGTQLRLVAENIEVVATGAMRSASKDASKGQVAGTDDRQHYSTITVLLEVAKASEIMFAQKDESLITLLRNRGDNSSLANQLGSYGKSRSITVYTKSGTASGSLTGKNVSLSAH